MARFIDALRTLFGHWWLLPSVVALISLVGFVSTLVDPWCYFSRRVEGCEFALDNARGNYPGIWGGLRLFGTGFLYAFALFTWPLLRGRIVRHHGSWLGVASGLCFVLGYFALLYSTASGFYQENSILIEQTANESTERIKTIWRMFWILVMVAGCAIAIFGIYIISKCICITIKKIWSELKTRLNF